MKVRLVAVQAILVSMALLATFLPAQVPPLTAQIPQCPATINLGETIQCSISALGETDTYTFSGTAGDRVIARMLTTSGNLYPGVRIYRPDGTLLCSNSTIFTLLEIACSLDMSGTHTLVAYSTGADIGTYNLHLQRSNNPANTTPIAFGNTLSGALDPAPEMDIYTFSGTAGDRVIARMLTTSGNLYPGVRIYRPDGTLLCSNSTIFTLLEIACSLDMSGTHTLVAYSTGADIGTYNLHLQRSNNPANATPIISGQTLSRNIATAPEMDAYTFSGATGDWILVGMKVTSGDLNPEVRVYRPDGTLLCSNSTIFSVLDIQCSLDTTGTYTIFAAGGATAGNYNLEIDVGKWYIGRHSTAPIAFAAEGPIRIKVSDDLSRVIKISGDPTCLPHEDHAFSYEPGLTLPIADQRFLALGVPLNIPAAPGHAHSMDIDGVFFDADGDGVAEQIYGGFTFRSGQDVCDMRWNATSKGPDTDRDGWSDAGEQALGASHTDIARTPENVVVPTTILAGSSVCEDFKDNDGDGLTDTADPNCPPVPGTALRIRVIGPERASPGQTIAHLVEYANGGSVTAEETLLFVYLDPLTEFVSGSAGVYYDPFSHLVSLKIGDVLPKATEQVFFTERLKWGVLNNTELETHAYITDLGDTSGSLWTKHELERGSNPRVAVENGCSGRKIFSNGMNFNPDNDEQVEKLQRFANENDADWIRLYAGIPKYLGHVPMRDLVDAGAAKEGVPTTQNGLGGQLTDPAISDPCHPECIAYSGATISYMVAIEQGILKCESLVLISPMLTNLEQLRNLVQFHEVDQITIFQSQADRLFPCVPFVGCDWKISATVTQDNQVNIIEGPSGLAGLIDFMVPYMEEVFPGEQVTFVQFDAAGKQRVVIGSTANGAEKIRTYDPVQFKLDPKVPHPEPWLTVTEHPGVAHGEWIPHLNTKHDPAKSDSSKTIVAAARDPNAKHVDRQLARPSETLNFTVEFENEGEGIAFGVYVVDTLDPDIDVSTLTFPSELPPLVDSYTYNAETRTIVWYIGEVGPSVGGKLTYSAAVRRDAPSGTLITNYATVFFPSVPETTSTNGVAVIVPHSVFLPLIRR